MVKSGLTYSHLDVRFEHRDRSSNRRVLKPDMTVSGLSSCPASMSGLRTKLLNCTGLHAARADLYKSRVSGLCTGIVPVGERQLEF